MPVGAHKGAGAAEGVSETRSHPTPRNQFMTLLIHPDSAGERLFLSLLIL